MSWRQAIDGKKASSFLIEENQWWLTPAGGVDDVGPAIAIEVHGGEARAIRIGGCLEGSGWILEFRQPPVGKCEGFHELVRNLGRFFGLPGINSGFGHHIIMVWFQIVYPAYRPCGPMDFQGGLIEPLA